MSVVPELLVVEGVKAAGDRIALRTYRFDEYLHRVSRSQQWRGALGQMSIALANAGATQPTTSQLSGTYNGTQYGDGGAAHTYRNFNGTVTTPPGAQAQAAADERARAQIRGMWDQMNTQFAAISESIFKPSTLDPGESATGIVYLDFKKANRYEVEFPIGGETFRFDFGAAGVGRVVR